MFRDVSDEHTRLPSIRCGVLASNGRHQRSNGSTSKSKSWAPAGLGKSTSRAFFHALDRYHFQYIETASILPDSFTDITGRGGFLVSARKRLNGDVDNYFQCYLVLVLSRGHFV